MENPNTLKPEKELSFDLFSVVGIILLAVIAIGAFTLGRLSVSTTQSSTPTAIVATATPESIENEVACTMDAMICPDGSSVGRIGPNCEFAPCAQGGQSRVRVFNFSITLPDAFTLREQTETQVKIGTEKPAFSYLTISKKNSLSAASLPTCAKNAMVFPCLWTGNDWGQQQAVQDVLVGGKAAKSFYIASGTVDAYEHLIQVSGEFEARMKISGGGLDKEFKEIIQSLAFEDSFSQ